MVYEILEDNMERLEKKLTRIKNKCIKYGCEFEYRKIGETFREFKPKNEDPFMLKYIQIEASGKARINDWRFVATVDNVGSGNIFSGVAKESVEIPERYYNCDIMCEHCKTSHKRKYAYIVHNDVTGEFKMVGKNCLNDFTNGLSAEAIASYYACFDELVKGESVDYGGSYTRYLDKMEILLYVCETIKKFGYVKKNYDYYQESIPTSTRSNHYFWAAKSHDRFTEDDRKEMNKVNFNAEDPDNIKRVKDALEWVFKQDESNNYFHNLITICKEDFVTEDKWGLLCSLFPTYDKTLEYENKKKIERERNKESQYVGNVGERIDINVEDLRLLSARENGYGGYTYFFRIVDTNGNVYTWSSSNHLSNDVKQIKATVKGHSEYNSVKQTQITRGKVVA